MQTNEVTLQADAEYVALLNLYSAETLTEVNASDWDGDAADDDYERTWVWSYAFERNDEARMEMEGQDAMGFT